MPARHRSLMIRASRLAAAAALVVPAFLSAPAAAQTMEESLRALRQEVEALRAGQQQTQKDLAEIKELLRGRGAGQPAPAANIALAVSGADPVKGDRGAKVVLFEFTDYQ